MPTVVSNFLLVAVVMLVIFAALFLEMLTVLANA